MPILSGPFIDFFTRLHWYGVAFWDYVYEHWFTASNFWKVWVFIFLQCIVMPISFLEKAWRRFIKVNVFGNSAFFFFSKGSSLQLKDLWIDIEQETGWEAGMLHCDYSSHIFGYRIFFFLLYQSGNTPVSCPTILSLLSSWSNSHCQISLQVKAFWLLVCLCFSVDMLLFLSLLLKCSQVTSDTSRFHQPLWNKGVHFNGRTYDYTWSAGNPHFELTRKLLATVHSLQVLGQKSKPEPE